MVPTEETPMHEDAQQQSRDLPEPRVDPVVRRRAVRVALGICGVIATATIFAATWSAFSLAILVTVMPGVLIAFGVLVAAASVRAPASRHRARRTWSRQATASSSETCPLDRTVTVRRSDDRWFLENERGDLLETSFADVVEWLDTLWDIRQLALTRGEADRQEDRSGLREVVEAYPVRVRGQRLS